MIVEKADCFIILMKCVVKIALLLLLSYITFGYTYTHHKSYICSLYVCMQNMYLLRFI
jgi:hypothetical protein